VKKSSTTVSAAQSLSETVNPARTFDSILKVALLLSFWFLARPAPTDFPDRGFPYVTASQVPLPLSPDRAACFTVSPQEIKILESTFVETALYIFCERFKKTAHRNRTFPDGGSRSDPVWVVDFGFLEVSMRKQWP